jgi:hypothetical protein
LRIDNKAITRDSQCLLLQAAGKIPLINYYREKWGWSQATFKAISWKTQKKALDYFDIKDKNRILKFVHGWLPTQNRLFKAGETMSQKCKLCAELYEDNFHLLQCQHPAMVAIQDDIPTFLLKQLNDHGNSKLINISTGNRRKSNKQEMATFTRRLVTRMENGNHRTVYHWMVSNFLWEDRNQFDTRNGQPLP